MPIRYTDDPAAPEGIKDAPEDYIVFYSSRNVQGQLWCPDCIAVEEVVKRTFEAADGPTALIVYVGQKPEWKTPSNPFRARPWNVGSVPTIIRAKDGARLVDEEIMQNLSSFVKVS